MKRTVSIILALLLCISLCACGTSSESSSSDTQEEADVYSNAANDFDFSKEDELTDSEVEAIVVKKLYKQIQYQWPTADAGSCRYSLNKIERTSHYITAYGEVYLYDKYGKLMSGSYSHTFKILCTADGETVYSCRFDN